MKKTLGEGGSEVIAVQVPNGTNVAQLEGKLVNNFGNYDLANRSILVVDQAGNILIPLRPMSSFKKTP